MNIEQAIDILKNSIADYVIGEYCEKCADNKICDDRNEDCYYQQAIDIVVTAYEKEKEKNKKIKWKPIKDYDRKKYDWVLVKYFDGDYECVPEVAEKRSDDKWYTSEKQIPFEVKYFFDMQEISEEE